MVLLYNEQNPRSVHLSTWLFNLLGFVYAEAENRTKISAKELTLAKLHGTSRLTLQLQNINHPFASICCHMGGRTLASLFRFLYL
jgi:hypothetical protein